jgi:hypothetical protein
VRGHEVDRFGRRFLRGHDEIALVLAIGIVGYDHHSSARDVAHDVVHGIELERFRLFRNHRVKVAAALWDVNALPAVDFAGSPGRTSRYARDKSPGRLDDIVARAEELHCASAQKGKW